MHLQMGGADSNYKSNVNMSSEYNKNRHVCSGFNSKAIINLFHFVWPGENNELSLHQMTNDSSQRKRKIPVHFGKKMAICFVICPTQEAQLYGSVTLNCWSSPLNIWQVFMLVFLHSNKR